MHWEGLLQAAPDTERLFSHLGCLQGCRGVIYAWNAESPPRCVGTTGAGNSPFSQCGQCPEVFVDGSSALTDGRHRSQECLSSSRSHKPQNLMGSFVYIDSVQLSEWWQNGLFWCRMKPKAAKRSFLGGRVRYPPLSVRINFEEGCLQQKCPVLWEAAKPIFLALSLSCEGELA